MTEAHGLVAPPYRLPPDPVTLFDVLEGAEESLRVQGGTGSSLVGTGAPAMNIVLCLPRISAETASKVEFYRAEREILSGIGETQVITSGSEIDGDADVVVAWWWVRSLGAVVRSRRRGIPILVTGATRIADSLRLTPRRFANNVASRVTAEFASANVAISERDAALLRSWRYPRLHVLPLAVDVDYFTPSGPERRDPTLFVTIAHLNRLSVERKGVNRVVQALARTSTTDARLVVVGEDQGAKASLCQLARGLGVDSRIEFVGSLDRAEKRDLLWQAGAYMQLSLYEGFGVAVAEAMAARCPVIVSSAEALAETTAGKAFAYVTSPDEAAEAMVALQDKPGDARAAAARAHEHAISELDYAVRSDRLRRLLADVTGLGSRLGIDDRD